LVGVFTDRKIRKGDPVGYFNGTIIREDFSDHTGIDKNTKIGYSGLEVTYEYFEKYCCKLQNQERPAWIIPDKICVAGYINHGRKDTEDEGDGPIANVIFREASSVYEDLTRYDIIGVYAIGDLDEDTELFAYYGPNYNWGP